MQCKYNCTFGTNKAILSKNDISAMHNRSRILLLKALEATLSKAKVNEMHNNSGVALSVGIKVQMKCFFFVAEFERAAKIRKIAVYRFLITLLAQELQRFKEMSSSDKKCQKKVLKSIKINKICDVM